MMAGKVFIALIFGLTILSGCVTKEGVNNYSEEEGLRNRAMTYWNHRVKDELDKSYNYEDPFYRKKVSLVNYIKSFSAGTVKWKAVDIIDLTITRDNASLRLKQKIDIRSHAVVGGEIDTVVADNWVKLEGAWYHVIQESGLGRGKD